ncbi:isocitrate/isopropylmalate dehydrogenase family protein [Rathayibacter iranicus]|uniref:Isocitrate/isopropylmalate dehydrogenase family protein n=2 Tax=Rathayibacter iranicus TaxID=59737 RepID=A0AAD1AC75_9MICO|nr:isocitrate/isopropylmalate family dehydrogenase [Rathayibacter iranicus]AZZ55577.1 isocitrate/isopropylmalate dehydrogenase family protein [Rathayibacter iranicus]MWV31044.1 isocitrate/isopropylmalate dehydrogenase family protein [Rathayibacter iranicus NCPPB 2253 = VKM Ac-1602]PPI47974.1 isocitrate/isopropylmalate dehydrogenase family protein [Rathayibacter iranicus]PPI60998.1 isocitrate/isopropylmalate dehydrogenase family protein [Rathayibacter iranicus]PPI73025.1 isocitrate/isopropylmal
MRGTKKSIAVLPGDGIGPEVMSAALPVLERLCPNLTLVAAKIGWECWCEAGDPVPAKTWELVRSSDATLLGAVTSKPAREAVAELAPGLDPTSLAYVSPVVQLRQQLSLNVNIRPILDLRGEAFDFVVVRENTEGLYAGYDRFPLTEPLWSVVANHPNAVASGRPGTSATVRLQTRSGLESLLRRAFELASSRRGFVSVADKPNVLRQSSRLVREVLESVAGDFPGIESEIINVDAAAMWIVTRPSRFDVLVAENMFGDILSDVGAGVMGGLGLASSSNIGAEHAYFEPVHGSAPRLVGTGRANPMAMFLTMAAMLDHLSETASAKRIRRAVGDVLREGRFVTYDLGGSASTLDVAREVFEKIYREDDE